MGNRIACARGYGNIPDKDDPERFTEFIWVEEGTEDWEGKTEKETVLSLRDVRLTMVLPNYVEKQPKSSYETWDVVATVDKSSKGSHFKEGDHILAHSSSLCFQNTRIHVKRIIGKVFYEEAPGRVRYKTDEYRAEPFW